MACAKPSQDNQRSTGVKVVSVAWVTGTIVVFVFCVLFAALFTWTVFGSDVAYTALAFPSRPTSIFGPAVCGNISIPGANGVINLCETLPSCFNPSSPDNISLATNAISSLGIKEFDQPYMHWLAAEFNTTAASYSVQARELDEQATLIDSIRTTYLTLTPADFAITEAGNPLEYKFIQQQLDWAATNLSWAYASVEPIVTPATELIDAIPSVRPHLFQLVSQVDELVQASSCKWMGSYWPALVAPVERMFTYDGTAMVINLILATLFLACWVNAAIKLQIRYGPQIALPESGAGLAAVAAKVSAVNAFSSIAANSVKVQLEEDAVEAV